MTDKDNATDRIRHCWQVNADPWVAAIEQGQIESRTAVTNQAIIEAVLAARPKQVLDIGCGEGWLVRALAQHNISACGVDGSAALLEAARARSQHSFYQREYHEITADSLPGRFDCAVCNFSLLDRTGVEYLFASLPALLETGGRLIIQTLHPANIGQHDAGNEGWRDGSWQGFSIDFRDPAPWYYRPTAGWLQLFRESGFDEIEVTEPVHPDSGVPASLIISGRTTP